MSTYQRETKPVRPNCLKSHRITALNWALNNIWPQVEPVSKTWFLSILLTSKAIMLSVCDVCHTCCGTISFSGEICFYLYLIYSVMSCFSFKQTECVSGQCLICTLFGLEVIPFQKNTDNKKKSFFHLTIFFSNRWTLDPRWTISHSVCWNTMYAILSSVQEGF